MAKKNIGKISQRLSKTSLFCVPPAIIKADPAITIHQAIWKFINKSKMAETIIVETNKTFMFNKDYHNLLNCLNENIDYIEEIYQELIKKGAENDSKIRDFEAS